MTDCYIDDAHKKLEGGVIRYFLNEEVYNVKRKFR